VYESKEDEEEKSDSNDDEAAVESKSSASGPELKRAATAEFKAGNLRGALDLFRQASEAFGPQDPERLKCLNNCALCSQQLGENEQVVEFSTLVLTTEGSEENVKALLRRGIAYEELQEYSLALDDMCTIMRIDPSHKAVADSMERLLGYISNPPPKKDVKKKKKKKPRKKAEVQEDVKVVPADDASKAPAAPAAAPPAAPVAPPTPTPPTQPASPDEIKAEGNAAFKAGDYKTAVAKYAAAISSVAEGVSTAPLLGNRALALLRLEDFNAAARDCSDGLTQLEARGEAACALAVKLLYRRGTALHKAASTANPSEAQSPLAKALADFDKIVELEPGNTKAVSAADEVRETLAKMKKIAALSSSSTSSSSGSASKANETGTPLKTASAAAAARARERIEAPRSPPKTEFELEKVRRSLRHDIPAWGSYLALIKAKTLPKILKESLSEDMLSSIILGIEAHFIPAHPKKALSFLKHLAKVSRFSTTLAFLGNKEKAALAGLFKSLESSAANQSTLKAVRKTYGC
jgi:tetratricopeptide (TPR) repeat protein